MLSQKSLMQKTVCALVEDLRVDDIQALEVLLGLRHGRIASCRLCLFAVPGISGLRGRCLKL